MIMAGADNADLSVLTEIRSEPAVPFAGKFRLIDFSLSNCVNSGIHNVAVLTQYRPRSLNDHIGIGKPWDLDRSSGGLRLLQPYRGGPYGDWQRGSADAIRRNLDYVIQQKEECVLILSGKHIYLMDYRPFLEHHLRNGAPVTIAVRRVSRHETHRFGIVSQDADQRVVEFQEKPRRTQQNLASMGVYIFNRDYLVEVLSNGGGDDIGRDILPGLVAKGHVNSYTYPGYWADASTVQAYWGANMSLLAEEPALNLYAPEWVVHTRSQERAPVKLGPAADVDGALLSNGCQIEGAVERSVLSPGVQVGQGALVRDSVVLNDTIIESGAVVERCVIDKEVRVCQDAHVGHSDNNDPNPELPARLNTGLSLVGKGSVVPAGTTLGRNVVIHPYSGVEAFRNGKSVESGTSVGRNLR
ncbi:MAG: glucose-1-phosphate adenylyltransferase [Caldilineaceae bacterium SB0668_bin_21]|nr:glucose-1-phosphate adenylyltransferase [Caldilineaceae bacterium SB0668_bin_21]